jgi:hypothetical protein
MSSLSQVRQTQTTNSGDITDIDGEIKTNQKDYSAMKAKQA